MSFKFAWHLNRVFGLGFDVDIGTLSNFHIHFGPFKLQIWRFDYGRAFKPEWGISIYSWVCDASLMWGGEER